mmetsp:Transcript_25151/g.34771  ORF Transcript_25151/g.34771 Transcript_25151/m.34771 type:complete len:225 (+) Transcript_25151:39-713(+)
MADEERGGDEELHQFLFYAGLGYAVATCSLLLASYRFKTTNQIAFMCCLVLDFIPIFSLHLLFTADLEGTAKFVKPTSVGSWYFSECVGILLSFFFHFLSSYSTWFLPIGFTAQGIWATIIYQIGLPLPILKLFSSFKMSELFDDESPYPPSYLPEGYMSFFLSLEMAIAVYICLKFQVNENWGQEGEGEEGEKEGEEKGKKDEKNEKNKRNGKNRKRTKKKHE